MNKLKTYEAPSTRVAKVELRTNLLAGSVIEDNQAGYAEVVSTPQEYEEINANAWGENGTTEDKSSIIQW